MKRKLLIKAALALALLFGASGSPAHGASQLIGYNTYGGDGAGVYSIPIDGSTACTKLAASELSNVKSAVLAGDTYYTSTQTGNAFMPSSFKVKHQAWTTDSWTSTEYTGAAGQVPSAACYNPTDGKVYGFWQNVSTYNFELKTIDYGSTTSVSDVIATVPESTFGTNQTVIAMAAANDGTMYAITKNGKLVSVTKDGTYAQIGSTGVSGTVAGAAFDPATGTLYYAVYSSGSKLYTIDVTNASATLVATLDGGMSFMGLGFIDGGGGTTPVEPKTPGAVTNLTYHFEPGSLDGTVTFDMPSTYDDGTPATGPCDYAVQIGFGDPVATGTSTYGATGVTADIHVAALDTSYYCSVYAVDGENSGEPAYEYALTAPSASQADPVAPGPVTNLKVETTPGDKNVTIEFDMPTTLEDGSQPQEGAVLGLMIGVKKEDDASPTMLDPKTSIYGQSMSIPFDMTNYDLGNYTLSVTVIDVMYEGDDKPTSTTATTTFTLEEAAVVLGAPNPVTNLAFETTQGSKDVIVKFDMPTTDVNGVTPAEGTALKYAFTLQKTGSNPIIKDGASVYGGQVSELVTVDAFGDYTCKVYVSDPADENLMSSIVTETVTVADVPTAPGPVTNLNVATTPGDKNVTISFTMPTALADGGAPADGAMLYPIAQLDGSPITVGDGVNPSYYAYGAGVSSVVDLSSYDFGTSFNLTVVVADLASMGGDDPLMSEPVSTTFTIEEATVTPPTPVATELVGYFVSPTGAVPGVYSISTTDGTYTLKKPLMKENVSNAVFANDAYYITTWSGVWPDFSVFNYGYNTSTWEQTLEKDLNGDTTKVPLCSAYNPVDGKVYAVFADENANNLFCTYDFETDTKTPILTHRASSPSDDFLTMAIAADGTIYAARGNGKLFTLNKETGKATEIGTTGLKFSTGKNAYFGSAIDPATGTFYLADNNKLYTIDVTTGAATELVSLEGAGRVVGLGMLSTVAPAPVPMPVENVKVNFEGEALMGNVSFTTPTKLTDGNDITDDLYYEVKVNGDVMVQSFRPVGYGQEITTADFGLEAGEYEFAVSVYTDAGSSEPVKVTRRIGAEPLEGIVPPYFNALNTTESADGFTMLNLNDDGLNWTFDSQNNKFYMDFNETKDMNAWFITPEINLEAGKLYEVSVKAYCGSSKYPERVAMWLGSEANPDMMFIPVMEPADVTTTAGETFTGYITVKTDGKYYLGIKGCSDMNAHRLYISDLNISEPRSGQCPGDVQFDVKTVSGSLKADIELYAPEVDAVDNPLTSIDKIELRRGDELIKTFESPANGATLTYSDNVQADGTYTYSTVAYNSYGAGRVVKQTVFVGTPIPASPTNARTVETSKVGEVTVSWDAPTTDKDGNPIDASAVRYLLVQTINQAQRTIADNIEGTSYTFQAVEEGAEQDMLQFGVFAKTDAGTAPNAAMTEFYPAGPAYELPVEESFPNGDVANEFIWAGSNTESAWWTPSTTQQEMLEAQDNDNGFMSSTGNKPGVQATLYFGKIAIAETSVNPVLTYWYYKFEEDENTITTLVEADGVTSTLATVVCGPEKDGWTRAFIPLDAYKGKNVRIKLVTAAVSHYSTAIDNIRVFDQANKDLTAVALTAPTNATAGTMMPVTVEVLNSGRQTASDYTVELFVDNVSVEKKAGTAIDEGETANVKFDVPVAPGSPLSIKLKAVVSLEGDENTADNTTDEVSVDIKLSTLPAPTDLRADNSSGSVVLNWNAPKLDDASAPKAVTDIFDDLATFTVDPDFGWTFIDVDGYSTWSVTDVKFPNEGYTGVGIVFDGTKYASEFCDLSAYSGDKCFMMFSALHAQNDDWMISPELTGDAQTVSFYAKPVQPVYSEEFEVYYSTTGKEVLDFKLLKKEATTEAGWKEYSYDLPEGTKYFAIHYISNDMLALAIDDITYIPANADLTSLTLKGYNVYRDGQKINDSLVTETTYTDAGSNGVDREYYVTAVYEQGESGASNKVMPSTGVDSIYGSDITVMAGRGEITVTGAEGMDVAVYTTDGRTVFNETGTETTRIRIEAGVYVVKAGTLTRKVIVK